MNPSSSLILMAALAIAIFNTSILSSQTEYFTGSWTEEGTTYKFDFVLSVNHITPTQVQGQFNWTFAEPDDYNQFSMDYYKEKIGLTAIEYVSGSFNPSTKEYHLKGYRKDDPNLIISLDEYRVRVIGEETIQGNTKSHGGWKGVIDGQRTKEQAL